MKTSIIALVAAVAAVSAFGLKSNAITVASITDGPAYETPLELLQKQSVCLHHGRPVYETPLET